MAVEIDHNIQASTNQMTYMELRREAINKAAYMLAELRGFKHGSEYEEEDWIAAERFVDAGLRKR